MAKTKILIGKQSISEYLSEFYEKVLQHGNKWRKYHGYNNKEDSSEPESIEDFCNHEAENISSITFWEDK